MMLSELIQKTEIPVDVVINGIADDSRRVRKGDLFCAVSGESFDGRRFVDDAVNKGAVAVLCEPPAVDSSVPVVAIENLRQRLGVLASRVYGDPSHKANVVAVTGTNGKTSFTHLLAQALTAIGKKGGVIGTMGFGTPDQLAEPGLTTPAAIDLQQKVKSLVDGDCQAIVLEASSHGLAQDRLNGLSVETAVFTNLTHDHLDYHESLEEYQRAKQRLFELSSLKNVVLNIDDDFGRQLSGQISNELNLVTFSKHQTGATVYCHSVEFGAKGLALEVVIAGRAAQLELPLFGEFNVENLLAVIAAMLAMQLTAEEIVEAIKSLKPVAGRMDFVTRARKPNLIIDYAHTPDALEKALQAVRQHFPGQMLHVVFGCGGDRDRTKRAVMGQIAERYADRVVVTSDNPRSEDPNAILADIAEGMEKPAARIADRREAILQAIAQAHQDDVVLIAGKGHEDYQELANGRIHFSDHEVAATGLDAWGDRENVILGLGGTGLSYARYLRRLGESFTVLDDAAADDRLKALRDIDPAAEVLPIDAGKIAEAKTLYVSPGVPLSLPAIVDNVSPGQLKGDVQMFGELATAPFVAITGTNGKSTVAQLFYEIASAQIKQVALGGNIGTPCLDVLNNDVELYVLEVSSYQLELASALSSQVAVVLNLSSDHLDRYDTVADYYATKLRLYDHCRSAVINRATNYQLDSDVPQISIGMDEPGSGQLGVLGDVVYFGSEALLRASDISLSGRHNLLNVQAAIAIGMLLDLDVTRMIESIKSFTGLPHRSELVRDLRGIRYVNDSKATNIGALIAAVEGESNNQNVHLIAGGVGKGADFSDLQQQISAHVKRVYLIGEAASELAAHLPEIDGQIYPDMNAALAAASSNAVAGDVVLLAPGCASFDQFKNYADRGDVFKSAVQELRS